MPTNSPATGCFSSSQATCITPHRTHRCGPMTSTTWGEDALASQLEVPRMPMGPAPLPAQQAASGFPWEPHAVSSGDSQEDSPLTEVCPCRPQIPNVSTASPRYRFSLSPILVGICGAATMGRGTSCILLPASQHCKVPVITPPVTDEGTESQGL